MRTALREGDRVDPERKSGRPAPTSSIEPIWDKYAASLRRFILRRVGCPQVAEDISQDVFLKILKHRSNVREESKFKAWMYQVLRHAIADEYRRRKAETNAARKSVDWANGSPQEDCSAVCRCLESLISQMPARYRDLIFLTTFEGRTQKEAAQELGLSLSGAKSRVQRGRLGLRRILLQRCSRELEECGIGRTSFKPSRPGD